MKTKEAKKNTRNDFLTVTRRKENMNAIKKKRKKKYFT